MENTRRLVTSALPYVNNEPHLGNLIQMLSADVFARFCRLRGYETLYVGGTDEYGTATETKAIESKTTPRALCDKYFAIHKKIYDWFNISTDIFGRTSNEECSEITQSIFNDLDKNGFITERASKQFYCPKCAMFLADRYARGTCPKCGADDARGDQCDQCGSLLDPTDLLNPRCATCGSTPELRETRHLFIDLPKISERLGEWLAKASASGRWSDNAVQMTRAWMRDGLNERAITRDLKWGIPVPRAGYESKVFYVWFNAPIGYISITKQLADELAARGEKSFDWKEWWLPSESAKPSEKVELFQFIGKDNIPFHTVVFPCSLIGTGRDWTKLHHMSATEFLNYENTKFSKSNGVGVFGTDAIESGIPADAWRFYIYYNRPEKSDFQFTWKDFQEKHNSELIGNLGNLVNRTLLFVSKYYGGKIPDGASDESLWAQVREKENRVADLLEWAELREAFHEIFSISDLANKAFQAAEPWKTRTSDPQRAAQVIRDLCFVIKDLMIMANPFMPQYTQKVMSFMGREIADSRLYRPAKEGSLRWSDVGKMEGLDSVGATEVYFKTMDAKAVNAWREKYSGKQGDRAEKSSPPPASKNAQIHAVIPLDEQEAIFNARIDLRVAKIVSVERNPQSDKLYVETLDDGSGAERVIQSGLVPFLKEDDLLGRHIILAANLAPRKMRGIESRGMLLAADCKDENGNDSVEILTAPWAEPGTRLSLDGAEARQKPDEISADEFFKVEFSVKDNIACAAGKPLLACGRALRMAKTSNGEIH